MGRMKDLWLDQQKEWQDTQYDLYIESLRSEQHQSPEALSRMVRLLKRWRSKQERKSRISGIIHRPPGFNLLHAAEFIFPRKIYIEVLEPTIRDLQVEYAEALAAGRLEKARWVKLRGYFSFWSAVIALAPISLIKRLTELWKSIP